MTDQAYTATAAETTAFVERMERLDQDRQDVAESMKELLTEAKGRGFDTKVLRKVVALRKLSADDRDHETAMMDLYKSALGMA